MPGAGAGARALRGSCSTVHQRPPPPTLHPPDAPPAPAAPACRWEAPGDGLDRGLFYHAPEQDLTLLAQYYDLPSLSLRAATWHLQNAGIHRFRVRCVAGEPAPGRCQAHVLQYQRRARAPNAPCRANQLPAHSPARSLPAVPSPPPCPRQVDRVPMAGRAHKYIAANGSSYWGVIPTIPRKELAPAFFLVDGMHPGDTGHAALAELLVAPLARAAREVAAGEALAPADRRLDPRLDGLPPPMIPRSQDESPTLCAMLVRPPRRAARAAQ